MMVSQNACSICKKRIKTGNVCTECSETINNHLSDIRSKLHESEKKA